MIHLVRDVLRILAARKLQRRESVAALVEVAMTQSSLDQQSLPVPFAEVGEVERTSVLVVENQVAAQLGADALFLQLVNGPIGYCVTLPLQAAPRKTLFSPVPAR